MPKGGYPDRLKSDFRKTFKTKSGQHVLMHLYTHLHGTSTSMPPTGNPFELAFNEGKRFALLIVLEQLKEDDQDMRVVLGEHIAERLREESYE